MLFWLILGIIIGGIIDYYIGPVIQSVIREKHMEQQVGKMDRYLKGAKPWDLLEIGPCLYLVTAKPKTGQNGEEGVALLDLYSCEEKSSKDIGRLYSSSIKKKYNLKELLWLSETIQ